MKLSNIACSLILSSSTILLADTNKEQVTLNEITITGEKLDRTLQNTTTSVQVFDEMVILNNSKMNDMFDLFEQTSNVNRHGTFGINIRGISTGGMTNPLLGPKTIEVNLDGVSQGTYASREGGISTWDMKQVEILKGPQSTTQGRNSLAGAIVSKTNDPEFDTNGAVKVGYGSYNTSSIAIMQTGAITDKLALRISAEKKQTDGFTENDILDQDDFNKNELLTLRGKLLYEFDNGANALLTLSKTENDEDGHYYVASENPYDRKNYWNTDGYWNSKTQSHSLEINYPINNSWSMKSVTGFADEEFNRLQDWDSSRGYAEGEMDRDSKNISQEFRFSYKNGPLDAIFGLYYTKGNGTNNIFVNDWDVSSFLGYPTGSVVLDYIQKQKEDYENIAMFFNSDYQITDKLTLLTGARLDKDKRENEALITSESFAGPLLGSGDIQADEDTVNFLPKLGLNYKWNKNINTGIVYSKGYRPGGISVNPVRVESKTYDAEYTDNIELSLRIQSSDKRLSANANIFYTKWKDQQVLDNLNALNEFDSHTINTGESTLKGIELQTKYKINNEIDIFANVGYIKTEFKDYTSNVIDYSGNEFQYTPNLTASIGSTYRDDNGYFLNTNINYSGDSYIDNQNSKKTNSRTVTNLKVGYEKKEWAVYLYANNLFDKEYVYRNAIYSYDVGDPRIVGITLTYNW